MTEASDALGDRIRPLLARRTGIVEKKMFGGVGFMLNGNMLIGTTAKGALLVRIDPEKANDAIKRGAEQMHMGPRPMTGFVAVDVKKLKDADAIKAWIDYALPFVKSLPAK